METEFSVFGEVSEVGGRTVKRSQTKLLKLIEDLTDNPATIPPGWDGAQITHEYLARLDKIIDELVDLSVEGDHKGRHYVRWSLRSIYTHENVPDLPIDKLPYKPEPDEVTIVNALRLAVANASYANSVVERIVRNRDSWLRHFKESKP